MFHAMIRAASDSVRQLQTLQGSAAERLSASSTAAAQATAHPALTPHRHAQNWQQLVANAMARHAQSCQGMWALALQARWDFDALNEALALQRALLKRCGELQAQYFAGLQQVASEAAQLRRANTVSKLFEDEYNVMAQLGALNRDQLSALAGLWENFQVDQAYLITRKLQAGQG